MSDSNNAVQQVRATVYVDQQSKRLPHWKDFRPEQYRSPRGYVDMNKDFPWTGHFNINTGFFSGVETYGVNFGLSGEFRKGVFSRNQFDTKYGWNKAWLHLGGKLGFDMSLDLSENGKLRDHGVVLLPYIAPTVEYSGRLLDGLIDRIVIAPGYAVYYIPSRTGDDNCLYHGATLSIQVWHSAPNGVIDHGVNYRISVFPDAPDFLVGTFNYVIGPI